MGEPLIERDSTRTLRRWVGTAAEELAKETGDDGWHHLTPHYLRRTWATALVSADVDPLLVCARGGWEVRETFLDHYRGTFSPETRQREREKSRLAVATLRSASLFPSLSL